MIDSHRIVDTHTGAILRTLSSRREAEQFMDALTRHGVRGDASCAKSCKCPDYRVVSR